MNIKDEFDSQKVTFNMQDSFDDQIDKFTSIMSKLTAQDDIRTNSLNLKYIKETEETIRKLL